MKEVLPKLSQKTLTGSPSVIFSLVSAAGLSRSDLREFRKTRLAGREARLASRSARRENNSDNSTRDTSRQSSSTSSASAALQSSLGNRLRRQLQNRGCAIYKLTWREKTTPSGLPYSQLAASAPRTNATDSFSERINWPTPTASNGTGAGTSGREGGLNLQTAAQMSGWATPILNDATGSTHCYSGPEKKICLKLPGQVKQAAWPTPRAVDGEKNSRTVEGALKELARGKLSCVPGVASLTQPIRISDSGLVLTGSDAEMESSGQLNPAHSRWLMGFPPEWDDCAVTAMQSFRK